MRAPLEAGVRELRMLSTHAPPYNRRSKFPYRWWWVALTDEAFPRLSVIRAPRHDRVVGPFRSRSKAAETAALLARCTGLRTCTTRLTRSARHGPACPELEVSACPAARDVTAAQYAEAVPRAAALIGGLTTPRWPRPFNRSLSSPSAVAMRALPDCVTTSPPPSRRCGMANDCEHWPRCPS